jgi:hemerythrin
MPLLEWTDRLSVGVEALDAEHRRMIALINELFDAISEGKGKDALGPVLDKLIDYTQYHFGHEERLMAEHAYAGLDEHRREHEALTGEVLQVRARHFSGSSAVLSIETMAFLKGWLLRHIHGTDKLYGPHLR